MNESSRVIEVVAGVARIDGHVLLGLRHRDDELGGFWEFPGGKVEEGEDPRDALRREFLEEFSVEIDVGRCLGSAQHRYDHATVALTAFLIQLRGLIRQHPAHECVAWVPIEKLEHYSIAPADRFICQLLRNGDAHHV